MPEADATANSDPALGNQADRNKAPRTMFQAETVSGLCLVKSGFCTTVVTELQSAAPRMSRAPVSRRIPCPSLRAIKPIPANDRVVPIQARTLNRSPSTSTARPAVMIGVVLVIKVAAPAENVVLTLFRRAV